MNRASEWSRAFANCAARLAHVLLLSLMIAAPLQVIASQRVRGIVLLPDGGSPASGVLVTIADANGNTVAKTLTDTQGQFELSVQREGRYDVVALRIGFRPTVVRAVEVAGSGVSTIRVVLTARTIVLAPVRVHGENVCRIREDSGQLVVQLWEQARAALNATLIEPDRAPVTASVLIFTRTLDAVGRRVLAESSTVVRGSTLRPFASLAPDSLARVGFVVEDETGVTYHAPDADVLLSEAFVAGHCFRIEPPTLDHPKWVGIGVRPARQRDDVPDIAGILWIDRASSELRSFEYLYTGIPSELAKAGAGGRVDFLRLAPGPWIVSRWEIRMPQAVLIRSVVGVGVLARVETRRVVRSVHVRGGVTLVVERAGEVMYRSSPTTPNLIAAVPGAQVVSARAPPETGLGPRLGRARITGRVTDAADGVPLAGARVQLARGELSRTTNSDGRFEFFGVAAGDYDIDVRRIGYEPASIRVGVSALKPSEPKVALRRLPAMLAEVRVEGRMLKVPPRFEEVYRRAASGLGRLITRDDIERLNATNVKSLLMSVPGVLVNDRGITIQRCQAGLPGPLGSTQEAKVQVYIDGARVTRSNSYDNGVEEALRLVHPSNIEAIEIYTGVAQIPAEFLSDACAVIAIWTKAY